MTKARDLSQVPNASLGFKNRIINGAMMIDQRNAGASVTPTNQQYSVDRWLCFVSAASKYTVQQNAGSVTPPVGFVNYLGVTSSSAYSVGAGEVFGIEQRIEGTNTSDLSWGTASAKSVTLSFQVYSSLTGTFGGAIRNNVNNRSYPFTYTISSANTWTSISVTIPGDTSGSWVTGTTGAGVKVTFSIGTGSTYSGTAGSWAGAEYYSATGATSVVGTNGATFYITGVQLEKGSTATSFDYRPYGTELALCQRYYYSAIPLNSNGAYTFPCFASSSSLAIASLAFPVTMRATPTLSATSGTNYYDFYIAGIDKQVSSVSALGSTTNYTSISGSTSGLTAGQAGVLYISSNATSISYSAEL